MLTDDRRTISGTLTSAQRGRTGRHAEVRRRFQQVRTTPAWRSLPEPSAAAATNLVRLATTTDADDYRRLDDLLERFGHERVAAMQDRVDDLLGTGPDLPVLTAAIRRLSNLPPIEWRLRSAGVGHAEATRIAGRCHAHMFWMLLADVDDPQPRLVLQTPEALADVIERGNARQWRALVAPVARNPWGPEGARLVALACDAHLPLIERALIECRGIYRRRQEARERDVVAREIRRMIAVSGLSQREFSAYVGTSPSRLSTYVTGKVTPSATMLLRIKGAARMLCEADGRSMGLVRVPPRPTGS